MSEALSYTNVISYLFSEVDRLIRDYVFNGYHALSSCLALPLLTIAAIYIVILGYGVMMGSIQISVNRFLWAVIKVALIAFIVMQWDVMAGFLVDSVNTIIQEINTILSVATPHQESIKDANVNNAMQMAFTEFAQLGTKLMNVGGFMNLTAWIDGLVVWIFGGVMVGLGLFELILAKVMLAILFVFLPLVVLCCYFQPVQGIFDRWLGTAVGFILLQLFVTAALAFSLTLVYAWLHLHADQEAIAIGHFGVAPMIVIGIVCIGLVTKSSCLAQYIGGSVVSLSVSYEISEAVHNFVRSRIRGHLL